MPDFFWSHIEVNSIAHNLKILRVPNLARPGKGFNGHSSIFFENYSMNRIWWNTKWKIPLNSLEFRSVEIPSYSVHTVFVFLSIFEKKWGRGWPWETQPTLLSPRQQCWSNTAMNPNEPKRVKSWFMKVHELLWIILIWYNSLRIS